ncbi:hypothetical protein B0H14DRAFT_1561296 [Mycena olivaceomarginata]|nr:hypothetical protein B0H14DRAFT_1561296 [Mycena olivaceomarginata]
MLSGGQIYPRRSQPPLAVESICHAQSARRQSNSPAALVMLSGGEIHPPHSQSSLAVESTRHPRYILWRPDPPATRTTSPDPPATFGVFTGGRIHRPPWSLTMFSGGEIHTQPFLAVESTCQSRCFLWWPDPPAIKLQQIAPPTYSLCKITLPTPSICLATCSPRPAVKSHRQHFYFDWWWDHTANMLYGIVTPHTHSFRLAI